jgi:transcriptional regulator with XRE-family HTH domain
MPFYERYVELCSECGVKPQNPEMQRVMGVSSGAISGWKKGADPKVGVLIRLSKYFGVTVDYLLGLSEARNPNTTHLTEHEQLLIEAYRTSSVEGQFHIVQVCMNEREKVEALSVG